MSDKKGQTSAVAESDLLLKYAPEAMVFIHCAYAACDNLTSFIAGDKLGTVALSLSMLEFSQKVVDFVMQITANCDEGFRHLYDVYGEHLVLQDYAATNTIEIRPIKADHDLEREGDFLVRLWNAEETRRREAQLTWRQEDESAKDAVLRVFARKMTKIRTIAVTICSARVDVCDLYTNTLFNRASKFYGLRAMINQLYLRSIEAVNFCLFCRQSGPVDSKYGACYRGLRRSAGFSRDEDDDPNVRYLPVRAIATRKAVEAKVKVVATGEDRATTMPPAQTAEDEEKPQYKKLRPLRHEEDRLSPSLPSPPPPQPANMAPPLVSPKNKPRSGVDARKGSGEEKAPVQLATLRRVLGVMQQGGYIRRVFNGIPQILDDSLGASVAEFRAKESPLKKRKHKKKKKKTAAKSETAAPVSAGGDDDIGYPR